MSEKIRIASNELVMLNPLGQLQKAVSTLRPFASQFNRLSVTGATQEFETQVILETLKTIASGLSDYGTWREHALMRLDDYKNANANLQNVVKIAAAMEEPPIPRPGIDPRKLLRLDVIANEIIPHISAIWFSIHACGSQAMKEEISIMTYGRLLERVTHNLVCVLNRTLVAFDCVPVISEFIMLDTQIKDDELSFELHDEVVAFSEEEIAEQKRLEAIEEENARRAAELEEMKKRYADDTKDVLEAYDKHVQLGNLTKFSFTDEALELLHNPSSMEDLEKCNSLYKFLMAMSNSVRFMPNEDGTILDRIMGSFMELNNDVLSYGTQFTVYLNEYDLTHNDVVNVLTMFDDENGKIVAQYVDSKEYIEEYKDVPKAPKMIHIFVMK